MSAGIVTHPIAFAATAKKLFAIAVKLTVAICAAPQQRGRRALGLPHRRPDMRNYEMTAFGAVALVAQMLVVAAIFAA